MDNFVRKKLTEWGFPERLEDKFNENEVDEETFNNLSEEDLKELVPILAVRKRFQLKYTEFKLILNASAHDLILSADTTETEQSTGTSSISDSAPISYPQKTEAPYVITSYENTVKDLIENTDEGRIVKASYGAGKKFLRSKLCELIIKNELKNHLDKRISSERFRALSLEISDVFSHEAPEIYYVSYVRNSNGKPKAARGKLWSTYCYLRRNFKHLGLVPKSGTVECDANTSEIVEEGLEEHVQWLTNNCLPFPIVTEKWKSTTNYRIAQFPETIDEYLNTYKCLKQPTGYLLFEIDFENIFGEKQSHLMNKWPQLHKYILDISRSRKDPYIKKFLADHDGIAAPCNEIVALLILPLLFSCVNLKSKKPGQHWRPSKSEIQNGFLLHLKTINELETELSLRATKYANFKLTAQPIPVIIGESLAEINQCYVCVNDIRYQVNNPLKALDLCFKIFHRLNAEYPKECDSVWMYVQTYIQCDIFEAEHKENACKISFLKIPAPHLNLQG